MEEKKQGEIKYWNPANSWVVIFCGIGSMFLLRNTFGGGILGAAIAGGIGGAIGVLVDEFIHILYHKMKKK
ncbi:MAG: hypothetical protein NT130_03555 [Candidatus Micrarchaeota archaeon]|nr:hypothetical protein [Candidatus Micrarchaeota archaeon]